MILRWKLLWKITIWSEKNLSITLLSRYTNVLYNTNIESENSRFRIVSFYIPTRLKVHSSFSHSLQQCSLSFATWRPFSTISQNGPSIRKNFIPSSCEVTQRSLYIVFIILLFSLQNAIGTLLNAIGKNDDTYARWASRTSARIFVRRIRIV